MARVEFDAEHNPLATNVRNDMWDKITFFL